MYAHKIEPFWFEVKQIEITLPHLDRAFAGYRIVQISDLHAGDIINRKQLNSVIDAVNEQKPDLVVITGDHVSRLPRRHVDLLDIYARLHPRDGALAILGNHDVYNDADPIRTALKMNGIKLLENDVYTLKRDRATLHIAGVGDVFAKEDKLDRVLAQLPPTGAAIMLAHEPDFADEVAATKRFGLQLSGHSHGGQIRLPFFDGYVPELAQKYPLGRYQVGDMIQYTNRGIGSVKIYARFNCRPEISVFTLS
jgi:predicted MPP superfamily phosphohydrolase